MNSKCTLIRSNQLYNSQFSPYYHTQGTVTILTFLTTSLTLVVSQTGADPDRFGAG